MKIYLPFRLRSALLAALSASSFTTLSSAYAAGEEEAKDTTLTILNADDPAAYPNKSAYQLEKVTRENVADTFNVYKSYYDSTTGSYKAEQYNVTFTEPLGETKPEGADYTYYKWVEATDSISRYESLDLQLTTKEEADLHMYSTNNNHLVTNDNTQDVDRSFFDLTSNVSGGAINHGSKAKPNITGNFVGNGAPSAGAISTFVSSIGQIKGDFIGNFSSHGTFSHGGAMFISAANVDSITGDFIANSSLGNFSCNGGAIYNNGFENNFIARITGSFIGNSAQGLNSTSIVQGGAIYNFDSSIGFLALDSSMQFTGNYISHDGGKTKIYEAIYAAYDSTLNFNAYAENSIVVNDGIYGEESEKASQIININNGRDGANAEINAGGKLFSTVAFNSFVDNHTIIVHAGELHLGKFTGIGKVGDANYIPSTQAELNNSSLTIKAGALVSVQGQLELDSKSSISSSAEGETNAVSTIKGLAADSSINGSSGVSLTIADNSKMKIENITLTNIAINKGNNAELTLSGVTLGAGVTSNSALSLTDSTLVLSSSEGPSLINTRRLRDEYGYYTLTSPVVMSEISGSLTLDITLDDTSLLNAGGLFGILLTDTDGISQSDITALSTINISINGDSYNQYLQGWSIQNGGLFILIPEPSTASLSLLTLAGLLARRRRKAA